MISSWIILPNILGILVIQERGIPISQPGFNGMIEPSGGYQIQPERRPWTVAPYSPSATSEVVTVSPHLNFPLNSHSSTTISKGLKRDVGKRI